jgi:pyruvate dehydrogenase E1 component
VPEIAANRLVRMFEAAGWQTITVKYGRYLRELFERDRGSALRRRLDEMTNEEYQRLLRSNAAELRDRLPGTGRDTHDVARLIADLGDDELLRAVRDLGGHDLHDLLAAFAHAERATDRPSVVFAYTIKAWRLATEGHPGNHSALLTVAQWEQLAEDLGADVADPWALFSPGTPEAETCQAVASRLRRDQLVSMQPPAVPSELGRGHAGRESTQQALGRFLVALRHTAPEVASHVVTVSPDVASSTNLGGWINLAGVWQLGERIDWFADDPDTLVRWRETEHGQHIELGIAEGNLVGLLGELGLTWSRDAHPLLPIGTLYDPFVNRALEPWSFGLYGGAQSILIGTPSGITLAPEGGAHQSVITPSVGLEQPRCIAWEPAFGQDLEWTLLHALSRLGCEGGSSAYFRLTTRPLDQSLAAVPEDDAAREHRRRLVVAGGYPLLRSSVRAKITLVAVGAVVPEALAAAADLGATGLPCDAVCLTSPDLVFRALQARRGLTDAESWILDELFPPERSAPIVSVLDGHPHTLSFLGAVWGTPITCLGISDFGQSGDVEDLYRHFGVDIDAIEGAAVDLLEDALG